jgi:hypothetical protein
MTELSPAAQAVFDAINKELDEAPWDLSFLAGASAAAALRAAAEQIVLPKYQYADWEMADLIMREIQAVADELEAQ